jgi:hypothetical protein
MDIINILPAPIWSAIFAALSALAVVTVTNRNNDKRLKVQLEHDATEKKKERIWALQKQIYLEAAENLTKTTHLLYSIPEREIAGNATSLDMDDFSSSAVKLQLVAEPIAAEMANKLISAYSEVTLNIINEISALKSAVNDIKISNEFYNKSQTHIARILSDMEKLRETGVPDQVKMNQLIFSFNFHSDQASVYSDDQNTAYRKFATAQRKYILKLKSEFLKVNDIQIPLIIQIRTDLGVSTNIKVFSDLMKNQYKEISDAADRVLEDYDKKISQELDL